VLRLADVGLELGGEGVVGVELGGVELGEVELDVDDDDDDDTDETGDDEETNGRVLAWQHTPRQKENQVR
jgi:hypothetical protein